MKTTLVARYERESTLWKNANFFYQNQDWTIMECLYVDYSDDRQKIEDDGFRWIDHNGVDITDKILNERYTNTYTIRLTNKRGTNSKCYNFKTREEANAFFLQIMRDKILKNFKRVC